MLVNTMCLGGEATSGPHLLPSRRGQKATNCNSQTPHLAAREWKPTKGTCAKLGCRVKQRLSLYSFWLATKVYRVGGISVLFLVQLY
jgi:hypothetical protein